LSFTTPENDFNSLTRGSQDFSGNYSEAITFQARGSDTRQFNVLGTFALMREFDPTGTPDVGMCMAFLLCLRLWDIVILGAGAVLGGRVGASLVAPATGSNTDANSENASETGQTNR
jgi:hypothetical protein